MLPGRITTIISHISLRPKEQWTPLQLPLKFPNRNPRLAIPGYDETICSTASIRSSIFAYEEEHGRTYRAYHAGKYMMPNDEGEQERLDVHSHAMRLSLRDQLFLAPIAAPTAILDVGTGTGIWAMDAADKYPGSEVIGFDLSPIQPSRVPPNLHFEVFDADEPWEYCKDHFSLVHTRIMNGFGLKSWPNFYQHAFDCLKPGGWVENQEFDCPIVSDDDSIPQDGRVREWARLWNEGVEIAGRTGRCDAAKMTQQMKDAGFENIKILEFKMPIGPWPKDMQLKEAGAYGLVALLDGIYGMSVKIFTNCLGWSLQELEVFLVQVRTELKRKSIHSYWPT